MADKNFEYQGSELELFSLAVNWRSYWQSKVAPFLGKRVLEVGAGIGSISLSLFNKDVENWTALEPDPELFKILSKSLHSKIEAGLFHACCGTLKSLNASAKFSSVIYIDVLEHIEDDGSELKQAINHLEKNGNLIILVPAHQFLYSNFDRAIGHYRRYNSDTLKACIPSGLTLKKIVYLDSAGFFASFANRFLLRSSIPTAGQIKFWDQCIVPISQRLDALFGFRYGKSLLAIYSLED